MPRYKQSNEYESAVFLSHVVSGASVIIFPSNHYRAHFVISWLFQNNRGIRSFACCCIRGALEFPISCVISSCRKFLWLRAFDSSALKKQFSKIKPLWIHNSRRHDTWRYYFLDLQPQVVVFHHLIGKFDPAHILIVITYTWGTRNFYSLTLSFLAFPFDYSLVVWGCIIKNWMV